MRRTLLAAVVLAAVLAAGAPEARADWSLSVSWSPYSSYWYAPAYRPAVYPAWSYPAYANYYYAPPAYYYPASCYYAPAYYYSPAPVFYYSCYRPWGGYPHHGYGGPMFRHGWGWGGFSYARWGHHRGWRVGWGW